MIFTNSKLSFASIAKSCGRPDDGNDVLNGRMTGLVYSFKDKVEYVCDEGYKLKGPAFRICQANEKWGGSQPICEGKIRRK